MELASQDSFDVIIIGGGINGTGVLRDCAMRGLKAILLEKEDIAWATTGASSGMIHGGVRYLTYDVKTTKISCIDSGYIQKIAPHLLFRIPFLFPIYKEGITSKIFIELAETFFWVYDRFAPFKNGKPHTRLSKKEALELEPGLTENIEGAVTIDEWGVDPFRLSTLNALSAAKYGGVVKNHTEVIDLILSYDSKKVLGVITKDLFTQQEEKIFGKIIVNLAGPWIPKICKMANIDLKLRPAKGIHLVLDRRISNMSIIVTAIDGRSIFLQPHENTSIIGTTDDDYYGNLDNIPVTEDEVEYLLTSVERIFTKIRECRIINVMAGVRPTLFAWGKNEDHLSREHQIFDHERENNVSGFITMAGGKLASYRIMAEELTDLICKKLNNNEKCKTHLFRLDMGKEDITPEELSQNYSLPLYIAKGLLFRHGNYVNEVLKDINKNPSLRKVICDCEAVIEAEIRYTIKNEWAKSIDDIRRRTRFGMGPCQGMCCAPLVAGILGEELKLEPEKIKEELVNFLKKRWQVRYPIIRNEQLIQEELNQGIYFSANLLN